MNDQRKQNGGRKKKQAEYHDGPDAALRFESQMRKIVAMPKERLREIEELERKRKSDR